MLEAFDHINKVTLHWAHLVLGWFWVCHANSACYPQQDAEYRPSDNALFTSRVSQGDEHLAYTALRSMASFCSS